MNPTITAMRYLMVDLEKNLPLDFSVFCSSFSSELLSPFTMAYLSYPINRLTPVMARIAMARDTRAIMRD